MSSWPVRQLKWHQWLYKSAGPPSALSSPAAVRFQVTVSQAHKMYLVPLLFLLFSFRCLFLQFCLHRHNIWLNVKKHEMFQTISCLFAFPCKIDLEPSLILSKRMPVAENGWEWDGSEPYEISLQLKKKDKKLLVKVETLLTTFYMMELCALVVFLICFYATVMKSEKDFLRGCFHGNC